MSDCFTNKKVTNKIAVLGGTGEVGRSVVQALNALGYQPTVCGRRSRPELADYCQIDIFNEQQVTALCQSHDWLINAAGPASVIGDSLARIAVKTDTPYIDVSGEIDVYHRLTALFEQTKAKTTCVLGAGFVPGLASLFALYVSARFQQVDHFEIYVGGIERFTVTSAQDFIASLTENQALSGMILREGELVRIKGIDNFVVTPDAPRFSAIPYLSDEHQRIASQLPFKCYSAFNLIADKQLLIVSGNSEEQVNHLVVASDALTERYGSQQHCIIQANGWAADQPVRLQLRNSFLDGYAMTGWVAALTLHQLLNRKNSHQIGLCWLSDVIDVKELFSGLKQNNLFSHWQSQLLPDENMVFEEGAL